MTVLSLRFCARAYLQLRRVGTTPHRGARASHCRGLSLSRPLSLRSTGSRRAGPAIVAHGPSCSAACGIFPDRGPNPRPLHWQADSQPLRHQGSPDADFCITFLNRLIEVPKGFSDASTEVFYRILHSQDRGKFKMLL